MNVLFENLSFAYQSKAAPDVPVFDHVNLSVASGECIAVVGEEGTGKSTLLQLVNGLQRPDSGRVVIDEVDLWKDPKGQNEIRKKIGFAFQFPEQQFFCDTVRDEMLYAVRNFHGVEGTTDRQCAFFLRELGLSEDVLPRSPFSLSMGEARRVALASLLVQEPDAFLLDEPTAGLDGFGIEIVRSLLLRLKEKGRTILIASHEHGFVTSVASRVVVVGANNIRADTSVTDFRIHGTRMNQISKTKTNTRIV